jgi:pimeloyl-ACP methyl ester carboxylesterase
MKSVYKWVASIFGGVSALVGLGIIYQTLAENEDRKRLSPAGQLFDIGGSRLHAICQGQGTPTVILEAGLSSTHLDWSRVIPEIAKNTRVFAYDRGGYGWSDPCPKPRTGLRMVRELHTLLQKAGISSPYILVGHSYGGLLVRLYASQYPEEVAGIILVDGSPEDQRKHFPKPKSIRVRISQEVEWQIYRLRPILARIGIIRLRKLPNGYIKALPEEMKLPATALGLQSRAYDWLWTEEPAIEATCEEIRNSVIPDHIRASVLAAGKSIPIDEFQNIWLRLQHELSQKIPNCTYQIVEGSGHFIQLEQPKKVVEAVLQMAEFLKKELVI